ncbi:nuclear transport factor 2 family protein [Peribacillus kribbensis]|uniref:nuclear transport factor 2 family protein n=1 Tax=Peribacillus kribbensis TaxID=356658 RepID=UPI00047C18C9|nr:nuclear transport factor 2 family protein [Peribacillus kribbensis]
MNESKIIDYEESLQTAMLSSNVEMLDELIADDLIFVNDLGQILSKEADIEAHRSGNLKITGIDVLEQRIRLLNTLALTVTRVALTGTFGEEPINGEFCYTRVWEYRNGELKIISGHCSSTT